MEKEKQKAVFLNFSEYWHFVKPLEKTQRDIVFNSLPEEQQEVLQKSYHEEGWEDVFMRNQIDKVLDELKEKYNIDILYIRTKVISGKSHYMSSSDWDILLDKFSDYSENHISYIFGGLKISPESENAVLITRDLIGKEKV